MNKITISPLTDKSWAEVARIYESGIATKNATFQTEAPDWESWDKAHRKDCRIVAMIENKIVGWAALSNVSSRCVYSGVAEVSIYVDSGFRGMGVGDKLMDSLIKESELNGIWTLQAGIFPENTGSLKLHHKHGFRTIGIKERIGKMDNTWRDVEMLERRSNVVGVD
ncbi:MAG: N-acetyltransferase family protein [Bacteroidales bacterium]|nr:N-acetyltransferase family protein [Bacteroidales bacterium]